VFFGEEEEGKENVLSEEGGEDVLGAGAMALFVVYNIMSHTWNLQRFISPGFPSCIPYCSQQVWHSLHFTIYFGIHASVYMFLGCA